MPLTVGDRDVRPLTAVEVQRMVDAGILAEDERVELLHGVLTAVTPQSEAHVAVLQRLHRWLAPLVVAGRHDVRLQMPFVVPDGTSLPSPDAAVVERVDRLVHPTSARLVGRGGGVPQHPHHPPRHVDNPVLRHPRRGDSAGLTCVSVATE
jgi:hypothetical protein